MAAAWKDSCALISAVSRRSYRSLRRSSAIGITRTEKIGSAMHAIATTSAVVDGSATAGSSTKATRAAAAAENSPSETVKPATACCSRGVGGRDC